MERKYVITYYYNHGKIDREEAETEEAALVLVRARIKEDPECCANIMLSEYEKETPHKQSVRIERYANQNGNVIKMPY